MKHIRSIVICFFLLCAGSAFAQVAEDLDKAEKAFQERNFDEAIDFFEAALEKKPLDASITRRLAETYKRMGQINISAEWYKRTIELGSDDPMDMLYYAEALRSLEQYDEAVVWYGKFLAKRPKDLRAKSHVEDPEYFRDLFADTAQYNMKRLKINNADPVMGMCAFEGQNYLLSGINVINKDDPKGKMNYLKYLDIYNVQLNQDQELVNPTPVGKPVNTKLHDGPAFYCAADKTLYITRNDLKKKKGKNTDQSLNLMIVASKFQNGKWSSPQELKFNGPNFSNGHPTITKDGNTMIFVSNRDGGQGGTDLYFCNRQADGWSEAVNLGSVVNTEGNEMFPFIDSEGTLYFASDGHAGLGGLDLFETKMVDGKWSKPRNLGAPVNGNQDDFSLMYDPIMDRGFFCSNRTGRGNDDIFFYTHKRINDMIVAAKIRCEKPDVKMSDMVVNVVKVNTGEVGQYRISPKENLQFVAEAGEEIAVYMTDDKLFNTTVPIYTYKVPEIITDPYINLGEKRVAVLPNASFKPAISPMKKGEEMVKANTAINENMKASMNGAKPTSNSSSGDLEDMGVNNILFGYNSMELTPKEKAKLDKVADAMKSQTNTRLLVRAFCDSRGSFEYNKKLSLARADQVKKYLVAKGISENRFRVEWFGEDNPLNDCGNQKKCSEDEYSMNRRAELTLVPMK